jgi:hypothetical protein
MPLDHFWSALANFLAFRRYFAKSRIMSLLSVPEAFGKLFALEAQLWNELNSSANAAKGRLRLHVAEVTENTIRGEFLRWVLSDAIPSAKIPITRVELESVSIVGELDLEGLDLPFLVRFKHCDFNDKINLSDATIIGFDQVGGAAIEIAADRLSVKGAMRIHALGANAPPRLNKLRLCGAKIGGNLDMRGCSLVDAKQSLPLFADGLTVHGHVLLSDGFSAVGEIRLNGCNIYRNLDCSGASLRNANGYSLSAAGAHVRGSVYLSETQEWITYSTHRPFISNGLLRLEGATIDGDLDCTAGTFFAHAFLTNETHPSENGSGAPEIEAIKANALRVGADLLFTSSEKGKDKFTVHGAISLISASIGGDFVCDGAVLDFPGEEPLVADGISIAGSTLSYRRILVTEGIRRQRFELAI